MGALTVQRVAIGLGLTQVLEELYGMGDEIDLRVGVEVKRFCYRISKMRLWGGMVAVLTGVLVPKMGAAATFRDRRRSHNILIIEI